MVRYGVGTRAKRVGIVGIGGLGHLGIMIAKAMGASVTAISRGTAKREDALKLGADKYIATGADQAADFKEHARSLDLIICTINPPELDLQPYLSLLRPTGLIVTLGVVAKPFVVSSVPIVMGSVGVVGSQIGSPAEIHDLLALAAQHDIKPWVQFYNFDDINTALVDFNAGKPNFRFVLVNTDNGAEL
jgi:D-arabinose 1-dehydrogenase-like Zn-dependent alcohol dehydrogenase